MSAGMVLLSESLVSYVSPVSSPMYVHWNGVAIRNTCHHFSQSPWLHSCTQWMSPDAALSSEIISQSLPSLNFMHTAMSAEWCCQAGSPKHPHISSTMFHTHTHTHQVYNEKWCCHQKSPITALSCQQSICVHNERWYYTSLATVISHQQSILMIHSCMQ